MVARVGLIIPSSNRMVEREMVRAFPAGVQAHVTRLRMTGAHHGPLDELLPRIGDATGALLDAKCDVVVFHCTATSMEEGREGEARVLAAMRAAGAARAIATASSVRRALDALGAKRLALVTPYDAQTTEHEAVFLRAAGYAVAHVEALALAGSDAYCATPAAFWRDRAIAAAQPDVDAIFLSCANIATLSVIDEIEAAVGRPVVSSNQAVVWDALQHLQWSGSHNCPGRLAAAMGELI